MSTVQACLCRCPARYVTRDMPPAGDITAAHMGGMHDSGDDLEDRGGAHTKSAVPDSGDLGAGKTLGVLRLAGLVCPASRGCTQITPASTCKAPARQAPAQAWCAWCSGP